MAGPAFASGKYAFALESLEEQQEEEGGHNPSPWVHCNRAAINLELELYRASIRECKLLAQIGIQMVLVVS